MKKGSLERGKRKESRPASSSSSRLNIIPPRARAHAPRKTKRTPFRNPKRLPTLFALSSNLRTRPPPPLPLSILSHHTQHTRAATPALTTPRIDNATATCARLFFFLSSRSGNKKDERASRVPSLPLPPSEFFPMRIFSFFYHATAQKYKTTTQFERIIQRKKVQKRS